MISEEIAQIAQDENMVVFGMGPVTSMVKGAPGYNPEDFLPGVQSIVCFGIPLPKHVYHTQTYSLENVWRSQNLLYRRLDTLALRFSSMLEEKDEQSIPIYGCMLLAVNDKGVVVGQVNQMRMAEAVGIGIIGKNGLLLHSHYGARLMIGGLITTASLPRLHYPEMKEPGCPPNCNICADVCPVKAIMPERKQVKIMRCLTYTARTPNMSRLKFALIRARNKKVAARYMSLNSLDEHTFHICSKCVKFCPYGQKNELMSNIKKKN